MKNSRFIIISLTLILISFILRIGVIDKFDFWQDEITTVEVINGIHGQYEINGNVFTNKTLSEGNTLSEVISVLKEVDGGNGLLYAAILHYWAKIFGNTPFALRLFSSLFSVLTLALISLFTYRLFKNQYISLLAILLICFHPLLLAYSAETRSYEMATFFSLLSSYFLYLLISQNKENETKHNTLLYIYYSLSIIISLFSHYLTIYIFISHSFLILLYLRNKKNVFSLILVFIPILFIIIFWMISGGFEAYKSMAKHSDVYTKLALNYGKTKSDWVMPANTKNIIISTYNVLFYVLGTIVGHTRILLLILFFSALAILNAVVFGRINNLSAKTLLFLTIFTLVYVAFISTLALKEGHCVSFIPRYANFVVPYFIMLLSYGVYLLLENKRVVLKISGSLLFLVVLSDQALAFNQVKSGTFITPHKRNFNFKELAKKIEVNYQDGDTICFKNYLFARKVNLFLPISKTYIQKIDTTILSKLIMLNKKGKEYFAVSE